MKFFTTIDNNPELGRMLVLMLNQHLNRRGGGWLHPKNIEGLTSREKEIRAKYLSVAIPQTIPQTENSLVEVYSSDTNGTFSDYEELSLSEFIERIGSLSLPTVTVNGQVVLFQKGGVTLGNYFIPKSVIATIAKRLNTK